MEKTRIVLSFDDGRRDNYRVAKVLLEANKIPATFNITSGYLERKVPIEELCPNEALTLEELIELSQCPYFEIAGHGYAHLNTVEDWHLGMVKLEEWLSPGYFAEGYGIASPHSELTRTDLSLFQNNHQLKGLRYIRTGLANQRAFGQRLISKIARATGNRELMYFPVSGSFKRIEKNTFLHYSLPVLYPHSFEQVQYCIEKLVQRGGDLILMFHSILKKGEPYYNDLHSWDYQKFEQLCKYLIEKQDKGIILLQRNIDLV